MTEVIAYNVVLEQDSDILNQGTANHIKNYFARKEKEDEEKKLYDSYIRNIVTTKINRTTKYSVGTVSFVLKLFIAMLFVIILWDFIRQN